MRFKTDSFICRGSGVKYLLQLVFSVLETVVVEIVAFPVTGLHLCIAVSQPLSKLSEFACFSLILHREICTSCLAGTASIALTIA